MLFDAALRRELGRSFAATLVVVLTIVITMMLIRMLGLAARGSAAAADVLVLLAYSALSHLGSVLSLSLFVSVVLTLGRMHRDSEVAIWHSSGLGLQAFLRPIAKVALPVVVVVGILSLFAWPWVNQQSLELRQRYEQRSDLSRVTPGVFQSSADGTRVFYIDRERPESVDARNVFLLGRRPEAESITTARAGRIESRPGQPQVLVLEEGYRTDVSNSTGESSVAGFSRFTLVVKEASDPTVAALPPKATHTWTLLQRRQAQDEGELAWRLGMTLACVNLVLLGVGLAAGDPRRPSNWNLVLALLAFVVYFNLVNLSQAWISTGRWTLPGGLLVLHGGAFLLAGALLAWRERGAVAWRGWRWATSGRRKAAA